MKNTIKTSSLCPCQSGKPFVDCCQPLLQRSERAATAEALMRSRYTAFTLLDEDYLRHSWHPDYCPENVHLNEDTRWLGLSIKKTVAGKADDETGEVEFVARSKNKGKASRLHENSRFSRYQERWVYMDGKFNEKFNK